MRIATVQLVLFILLSVTNAFTQSAPEKIRISVPPGQNKDIKVTEPRCLELTGDYQTKLSIMGQTFAWTLPKGTKYIVNPDSYHIANSGPSILEIVLLPESKCSTLGNENG